MFLVFFLKKDKNKQHKQEPKKAVVCDSEKYGFPAPILNSLPSQPELGAPRSRWVSGIPGVMGLGGWKWREELLHRVHCITGGSEDTLGFRVPLPLSERSQEEGQRRCWQIRGSPLCLVKAGNPLRSALLRR